jgi:hypothetical protein
MYLRGQATVDADGTFVGAGHAARRRGINFALQYTIHRRRV